MSQTKYKYVSYEDARNLIYNEKVIRMDEMLIKLHKENKLRADVVKKFNPGIVNEDGTINLQFGEEKEKKIKMVCIGHETKKDNSTGVLLESNKINCFTGGCLFSPNEDDELLNIVQVYIIYKLGIDSELVLNKQSYQKLNKEKFKAIAELLEMKGYKIQRNLTPKVMTRKQREEKVIKDILNRTAELYHKEFLVNQKALDYFLETMIKDEDENGELIEINARGFKYVKGKEYALEMAKRFKIGFAPQKYPSTWLYDQLVAEYTTEELIKSGVVRWHEYKNEAGEVTYERALDTHSYGIIVPYWGSRDVYNVYSRAITASKDWRHLRNAGGNSIPIHYYEIVKHKVVNIVEGELTWLTKILLGYENTLGNRGTNGMSEEHINLLVRAREDSGGVYCQTIVLCFDGDDAGRKATLKTGRMLIKAGFNVLVVLMPEGMDQNDLVRKYKEKAKEVYDEIYSKPVSFYTFVALSKLNEEFNSTSEQLQKLAEIKQIITENNIVNEIELSLIASEYALKTNTPVDIILKEWKKDNKNVKAFYEEPFIFMSNNIENYYLLKFALHNKATYVEDTKFYFLNKKVKIKELAVDKMSYTEKELKDIWKFCLKNHIKMHAFTDLSDCIKLKPDGKLLTEQMAANESVLIKQMTS
ncbi:toprim domain-containing protein [Priestia filamentosa]|uniref:toprim domain-containing protein n=1 Tax=Priestia filamentosa TaxID=1402861 RepID=UPI00397C3C6E